MELISRAKAKAAGLKRYFTGEPCSYGHVCERNTKSAVCMGCLRVRALKNNADPKVKDRKNKYKKTPEQQRKNHENYNSKNIEKVRKKNREYAQCKRVLQKVARIPNSSMIMDWATAIEVHKCSSGIEFGISEELYQSLVAIRPQSD